MIKTNSIYIDFGDSRRLLKALPNNSVQMAVTSPPYNIGKPYGKYHDKISLESWEHLISDVTAEIFRVLTPNGSFFLNLSPIPFGPQKEILPLPYIGYKIMKSTGFKVRNIITWTFNNMQNCTIRLSGRYENIIWGVKNLNDYIFNLDDIRIPYITQNDKRLINGKGRNPTDVWYFNRVNNMTKKALHLSHPTIYPLKMIERIVKMSTNPGDTVLDPFLGSGTTAVAATKLGRKTIGFELDNSYEAEIRQRLKNETTLQYKFNT
mgnify:CR=1 FL=1